MLKPTLRLVAFALFLSVVSPAQAQFSSSGAQTNVPSFPPPSQATATALSLDDGTAEDSLGLTAGGQFLWFNQFTPPTGDFPLAIQTIQVYFATNGHASIGETVDLYIWQDTDGDPTNGATLMGSLTAQPVQTLDAFSTYILPTPVQVSAAGDVYIGVVNRTAAVQSGQFAAAIDKTASQGRSWIGLYTAGNPADPPILPADTFELVDNIGFPGNWMIRATYGPVAAALPPSVPVPTIGRFDSALLLLLLAAAGTFFASRRWR